MKIKNKQWKNKLELGAYLRSIRENRGMNQRQLAERLLCSWPTAGLIERGGTLPGVQLLRRMSAFYGISFGDLIGVYYPPEKTDRSNKQDSGLTLARS